MKWNLPVILIMVWSLSIACHPKQQKSIPSTPGKKIIAYVYPEEDTIKPSNIDVDALTHINYSFAKIEEGILVPGFICDSINLFQLKKHIDTKKSDCKLLVSVGGWEFSDQFSDMALSYASREKFIQSAIGFVRTFQLDGLDIDWEYPGQAGKTNNFRPEDKTNFTLLLRELRLALDSIGVIDQKHYITSIAAPSFPVFYTRIELEDVVKELDFINLMTYDFFGEWDPVSGHQSNLFSVNNPKSLSADSAVQYLLQAGVTAQKLVLGIPFYSRSWRITEPSKEHINNLGQGAGINNVYEELSEDYINKNGYVSFWDSASAVPYLWNDSLHIFVTYEDLKSVGMKCEYIQLHNLGGAMFWKYNLHKKNILLDKIVEHLALPKEY